MIQECIMEFSDSKYRNLLLLANSEIHILIDDVKTAIDILKNVDIQDQCYEVAKMKLAKIYLLQLKQSRAYTMQYEDIVDKNPSQKNMQMLASAYSTIQEYEKAIETYQKIEQEYELSENIAESIGRCYIKMFNFTKAEHYLREKIQVYRDHLGLRVELGFLLIKLKKYSEVKQLFADD